MPNKFDIGDLISHKNDNIDDLGFRPDTVHEIKEDVYILQDNYDGQLFEVSKSEIESDWTLDYSKKKDQLEDKSENKVLFFAIIILALVISIIYKMNH